MAKNQEINSTSMFINSTSRFSPRCLELRACKL